MKSSSIIFLMLVLAGREGVSAPAGQAVTALPAVESYEQLLTAIRQAKAESRERVEALAEQEKVREAWEIGKLIDEHTLHHKERADYGEQVLFKLAKDLETSHTELKYMLQFARAYPIGRPADQLSWSHYQALLALNDPKERKEVTEQAVREGWGRDQLREEVRRRQESKKREAGKKRAGNEITNETTEEVLTATPGKPGTYRVVKARYGKQPNQLVLDLGFSNYLSLGIFSPRRWPQDSAGFFGAGRGAAAFKEGDIVLENKGRLKKSKDASEKDLFTYTALVIRVIDGDTFTAAVDLGFGFTTVQTLRLRALDAPEIESAEGRKAKEFLEKTLRRGSSVLIRTHRSDKYDRYLADVFVDGEYVNQKLVDEGFAVPLSEQMREPGR